MAFGKFNYLSMTVRKKNKSSCRVLGILRMSAVIYYNGVKISVYAKRKTQKPLVGNNGGVEDFLYILESTLTGCRARG